MTVDQIIATLTQNAANACRLVREVVRTLPPRTCKCGSALRHAIITDRAAIPANVIKKLELIVGKYTGS